MVDEQSKMKLIDNANVITGQFGQETGEREANKLANAIQAKIEQPGSVTRTDSTTWMALVKRFLCELGIGTARTDANRKGKALAESLRLQKEIHSLQNQINEEVGELRRRGKPYVNAAQTAGHLINDVEYFVASNLLRVIRRHR